MTVAPESGSILALVGHHEQPPLVHTSHRHGIGSPCSRGRRHSSPSHHHRSIRARRTRGIHPQETTAPQESVDQIFLSSFQPFFCGLGKDDHAHQSQMTIHPTEAENLRQVHKTEETAPSITHPSHQHDHNLVQPRGLHSSSSQAIRLRFARPDARRWGIGLHHQLQGRLR